MSEAGFGGFRENRTPRVTSQPTTEMAAPRIIMKMPRSVSWPSNPESAASTAPGMAITIPYHQAKKTQVRRCA
jgi:hypothetical protein